MRTVILPVGGGLAAGVAVAVLDPEIAVVGAQTMAPYLTCWPRGIRYQSMPGRRWPTASRSAARGDIPFVILSGLAERLVTVSEESLSRRLVLCLERAKQVVERARAAGVAAALERPRDFTPGGSGHVRGHIDPLPLSKLLRDGLSAVGLYRVFRCRLSVRPGSLAKLLEVVLQVKPADPRTARM